MHQKTIINEIKCNGIGVHTGQVVNMKFKSLEDDSGIVFKRSDIEENNLIKADYRNVVNTNYSTTIGNEFGVQIATIEHLMAAVWSVGISNLLIEVDNIEIPIMDGSSEYFVFLLQSAGIKMQTHRRSVLEILKPVEVADGDKFIKIVPHDNLYISYTIDYPDTLINKQQSIFDNNISNFFHEIARARTFCLEKEVEQLRKYGFGKGGSMSNAIIIGKDKILNDEKLRYGDEFARHKILDIVGDLYLISHNLIMGKLECYKSGHRLNNKLLHEIFSDSSNYRVFYEM